MGELDGQTALVSGTSPNIGAGIAIGLARAGARVICLDRDAANAHDCARHLASLGCDALPLVADVADVPLLERAVRAAIGECGGVDVLVNGAAYYNEKSLLEMPVEEWRHQVDVVLTGTFVLTQLVATDLIARGRGGAVVNLASTAGHQGQPGNIAYCTAKAGILNFTRAAAMDLARHGIRVNSVTPTSTDPSESWDVSVAWGRPEPERHLGARAALRQSRLPLQQLPAPSDYAAAIVFLASPAAARITGIDLRVDAGALARYWSWLPGEA